MGMGLGMGMGMGMVRDVCWLISHVCTSSEEVLLKIVVDREMMERLQEIVREERGRWKGESRREAAWALTSIIVSCSSSLLTQIVSSSLILSLVSLLNIPDVDLQQMSLTSLLLCIQSFPHADRDVLFSLLLSSGLSDLLSVLSLHPVKEISSAASELSSLCTFLLSHQPMNE